MLNTNVTMFVTDKPKKNRRFTPYELQTEKELAGIFKRPMRTYVNDKPFYPWLPYEPLVNFDLKYKE